MSPRSTVHTPSAAPSVSAAKQPATDAQTIADLRAEIARQADGNHSNLPDHEPSDPALRRLAALERLLPLGDWEALREWRLSQMAALGLNQT